MQNYPSRNDIVTSMRNPKACFKAVELLDGNIIQKGSRIIQYSGGYTTVFPFILKNSHKVAIRCWIADIGEAKKRSQEISKFLNALNSPYFCEFKYVDDALLINGTVYPIVLMDWVEGTLLKEYINDNSDNLPQILPPLAENFKKMVTFFHENNIAHGDLQHGNILVNPDGTLVVIDYDSMFIEPLKGMPDQIKGLPGYQHPKRFDNQFINNKLDFFSELVIYLSLLVYAEMPQLWQYYYETEDLLFSKDDFNRKQHSRLIKELLCSKNRAITELIQKLLEQLDKTDIQHLEPLEEASINKLVRERELIASQWEKQPNPPQIKKPIVPIATEITNKF